MQHKKKLTIAITGLNNTDNPGPGVPVIRALRDSEIFEFKIIGLAYENLEPGIFLPNIVDKTYQIPYPSVGVDAFMNRISKIHKKEKLDAIIPNFDAELYTFMKAEEQLKELGIKTFLPTFDQLEERHKANLVEFGEKYDIKVPHSIPIFSYSEIPSLMEKFTYPVLVKGKFYEANIAYTAEQVHAYYTKISSKWGLPIIIQQFVSGTEVNVAALGDGKGNTIAAVPMRKQFITDKGKAWSGITLKDKEMLKITKDLIRKTKWRGAMELEMIRTEAEEYYLIEINPRIPAWVYLASSAGQNIPEALLKLILEMDIEPFTKYEVGKMFIRYSYDIITDISQFEYLSIKGEL